MVVEEVRLPWPISCHVYHAMPCVPCYAMCTMLCHVYHAMPCVPCYAMCAVPCHVYHAMPCVPCHAMCAVPCHVYHAMPCVPCRAMCTMLCHVMCRAVLSHVMLYCNKHTLYSLPDMVRLIIYLATEIVWLWTQFPLVVHRIRSLQS